MEKIKKLLHDIYLSTYTTLGKIVIAFVLALIFAWLYDFTGAEILLYVTYIPLTYLVLLLIYNTGRGIYNIIKEKWFQ